MRAAVYNVEKAIIMVTKPKPIPKAGHLFVKVASVGLNPVDAKCLIGDKLPESWGIISKKFCDGNIAGLDFSGVVEWAPEDTEFKTGDEVYGAMPPMSGSLAEWINVPLDQVALKPKSMSLSEAGGLCLVGLTAYQAFEQHNMGAGKKLLIIGASGGVGHIAVQIASALEMVVTGICSSRNFETVLGLGAQHVIDYSKGSMKELLSKHCREHGAFDMVLDCVSSNESRDQAVPYEEIIRGSKDPIMISDHDAHSYVTLGGSTPVWIHAGIKRITGLNLFPAGRETFWIKFPGCSQQLKKIAELVDKKGLHLKTSVVKFNEEDLQNSFKRLRGRETVGKICVDFSL